MKKPILVVMAAGMGSRYGGLKQMDPVGPSGEVILDYSVYDAKKAGFETVVFIIKHEIEDAFKERVGSKIEKFMDVRYAYQDLHDLPEGIECPEGRVKPWGTGQAILAAKDVVDAPFVIINSDDYYGVDCFKTIYDYLAQERTSDDYCMVGYLVKNTISENGSVTRGVCKAENGKLTEIEETSGIEKYEGKIRCVDPKTGDYKDLQEDTLVSMNMWGFQTSLFAELQNGFKGFLENAIETNPMKGEYLIPTVIQHMIEDKKAQVEVLSSKDRWFGVTYKEDKPFVVNSFAQKIKEGIYPEQLWK